MELLNPGVGLIFWMSLSFLILILLLAKFAWKPIMNSLKDREESIKNALQAADTAKAEMKELIFSNEELLKEAKTERDKILKAARKIKDSIIEDAKLIANEEGNRIIERAKESIHFEKMAAITELKNQIAELSIDIAEKVLREELKKDNKQKELIRKLINEITIN